MNHLTPIERIVIESLNASPKNLEAIATDLGIRKDTLFFILQRLTLNHFVLYKNSTYCINENRKSDINLSLKDLNSKKFEIKSILESAKHQYLELRNQTPLQIKKVYLDKSDQIFMQSLFSEMQALLNKREANSSHLPLSEKKIFYWGSQCYSDVLKFLEFC